MAERCAFNGNHILRTKIYLILLLLTYNLTAVAQDRPQTQISGSVGITNNGISFVPNFSLEQPAAIFNLALEKGRFSFEPEFTFSLEEGRAWYQVYWLRYKLINEGKFKLRTGGHLGFNFARIQNSNGKEVIQAERYLVGELAPTYDLSANSTIGIQYMIARGYDIGTKDIQHFISLNGNFRNIRLAKELDLEISPQAFFLETFGVGEGTYVASNFRLSKKGFPISLSTLMNKAISTTIPGKDFLWNLTLTYSFSKGEISIPAKK